MCHNCTIERFPFIPHLGWSIWFPRKWRYFSKPILPNDWSAKLNTSILFLFEFQHFMNFPPGCVSQVTWPQETEVEFIIFSILLRFHLVLNFLLRKNITIHKFPKPENLSHPSHSWFLYSNRSSVLFIRLHKYPLYLSSYFYHPLCIALRGKTL